MDSNCTAILAYSAGLNVTSDRWAWWSGTEQAAVNLHCNFSVLEAVEGEVR